MLCLKNSFEITFKIDVFNSHLHCKNNVHCVPLVTGNKINIKEGEKEWR